MKINNIIRRASFLDIKPIQEIKNDLSSLYLLMLIIVVVIILIILGIFLYLRKRRKETIASQSPPDEVALNELEMLKGSEYLEQQDYRNFYFRLSEIFRTYVEKRFGLPAQESTTEELIPQIEGLALTRAQKDTVRLLVRGEDLVKFARHKPSIEKAQQDWEETRHFILATTEKTETDKGCVDAKNF